MSDTYHNHREYASERHDHNEYADEHHRHYNLNREDNRLQQELASLREAVSTLSSELSGAWTSIGKLEERVAGLEADTPHARLLQRELDETLADNAAAGYGEDWEPRS